MEKRAKIRLHLYPLSLESEIRPIKCLNISSLWQKNPNKILCAFYALPIARFLGKGQNQGFRKLYKL